MKNPCYKCEKRVIGCHCQCAEYGAFKAESEEIRLKRNMQAEIESIQFTIIRTRDTRIRKRLHI